MLKHAVLFSAAAVLWLGSSAASAQTVLPGCLQPDRGLVRLVPGFEACTKGEVGVALQVRQPPASLPLASRTDARQALPDPAARTDAALLAFLSADRALAPLAVPLNRSSALLSPPARRTLAIIGPGLAGLQ
jgi:hypothetical protein